jgi:hypothetical protein
VALLVVAEIQLAKGPDMASPFTLELSMPEAPSEVQARAANALTEPARAIGLNWTESLGGSRVMAQ